MPVYEYQCEQCSMPDEVYSSLADYTKTRVCGFCGGRMTRAIRRVAFHRAMPEHYNHSVGRYVSNERQFNDALKQASEEATLVTGVEHNYVPVDLQERESIGVTDEGLDSTFRSQTDSGEREAKLWL